MTKVSPEDSRRIARNPRIAPTARIVRNALRHRNRYRNTRKPAVRIVAVVHNIEVGVLNQRRDRPAFSFTNRVMIYASDRRDFGGCSTEKQFVCDVKHFAGNARFSNSQSQIPGKLLNRVARIPRSFISPTG